MTEESERDDVVYQHPLSWRSPGKDTIDVFIFDTTTQSEFKILGLNKLIAKLDQRHERKEKKTGTFVAKKRVRSIHSVLSPPKNAPKWTIASEYNSTSQPLTVALSGGSSSAQSSELFPESESGHTPASASVSTRYRDDRPLIFSRVPQGTTPHASAYSSRPRRNLLNDIYSSGQLQTSSSSTADDIAQQLGDELSGSGSSSDSSSEYDC